MTDPAQTKCPPPADVSAYLAGELPIDQAVQVDEHLAECNACIDLARSLFSSDPVWDLWTARSHGDAYFQKRLTTALRETGERQPDFRDRLRHWRTKWTGTAEFAVRLVLDAPEAASRVVSEELPGLVRPGATLRLATVSGEVGIVRTRGTIKRRRGRKQEEALAAAVEAVRIHRAQASARPDAFRPDLARSLQNLATMLSALGRREEALAAAAEAVQMHRALAQALPDAFGPQLAKSLDGLATTQIALGRSEEARATRAEAVQMHRALAQARPDPFGPDLARPLNKGVSRGEAPKASLDVRRDGSALLVRLEGLAIGSRPPLIVLISADELRENRVQESSVEPGGGYEARFDLVDAGGYVIAIEPLEASN